MLEISPEKVPEVCQVLPPSMLNSTPETAFTVAVVSLTETSSGFAAVPPACLEVAAVKAGLSAPA